MCCDYRYLNTYTVGDAFPMATDYLEFDLEFRYTKGSSNVVADWLSRAVCEVARVVMFV